MSENRPLFLGLTVYEVSRTLVLAGVLAVMNSAEDTAAAFPLFSLAAANALFPLAALFLFLDFPRYSRYLPLYTAGKIIVFCTSAAWIFFSGRGSLAAAFPDSRVLQFFVREFFLYGDLFSAAAGLFAVLRYKDGGSRNAVSKNAVSEDGGGQCE